MTEIRGRYAEVNGLQVYYEVHGEGRPLILLHGGFGSTGMFNGILPELADGRRVIAVDLQAHGRTADIDRPLSFEAMADDVAALIRHLGLEKADVMGYSMGGGVALKTAIRHPNAVGKLVVVSFPFKREAWYPEVRAGMDQLGPEAAEPMKQSPIYQIYSSIAPRPEDWQTLCAKMGALIRRDYDWSEAVAGIQAPGMVVAGDADGFPPAHAAEFFGLLGGGQRDAGLDGSGIPEARLAILPGTTHYDSFASPLLASVVAPFLNAPASEEDPAVTATELPPGSDLPGGLGKPARRALVGAGYTRLEQFTHVSEAEVSGLHGMGPKALEQIRSALSERGLSFAGERHQDPHPRRTT